MDLKLLLTVFATVFIAEIGDKTQLATVLYATDRAASNLTIFIGASLALILSSAIGVLAGSWVSQWLDPKYISWLAGLGFIAVGAWTLVRA